jgi:RNA polymerase sigma factor (TIGR02999 family)
MSDEDPRVTELLRAWRAGDGQAHERVIELTYRELHKLAARYMRGEQSDCTLRTTDLVHEAYLRMIGVQMDWEDRTHFLAMVARTMRRVLVDHARLSRRQKRGSGAIKVPIEEALEIAPSSNGNILALDQAIERLFLQDARKAELVELLFFGGLTQGEAASVLKVSEATVKRDLRLAKAWLHQEMKSQR